MEFLNSKDLLIEIRKIMLDKNIKISELANKMNVSQAALSKLLKSENITLNKLLELCKALNCTLEINIIDRETGKKL